MSAGAGERRCRVCGSTETGGGETCAWVAADLCDFCDAAGEQQLFNEGDMSRAIAQARRYPD